MVGYHARFTSSNPEGETALFLLFFESFFTIRLKDECLVRYQARLTRQTCGAIPQKRIGNTHTRSSNRSNTVATIVTTDYAFTFIG